MNFHIGGFEDFGYAEPPAPECAVIPPLGQRSAKAIEAGHEAVRDIDRLIARLHEVRALLVSELRQDEDIRAARIDERLGQETAGDDAGRAIAADLDDERDYAEEDYNRHFCDACGSSPCTWDGVPDGFHTDDDEQANGGES